MNKIQISIVQKKVIKPHKIINKIIYLIFNNCKKLNHFPNNSSSKKKKSNNYNNNNNIQLNNKPADSVLNKIKIL